MFLRFIVICHHLLQFQIQLIKPPNPRCFEELSTHTSGLVAEKPHKQNYLCVCGDLQQWLSDNIMFRICKWCNSGLHFGNGNAMSFNCHQSSISVAIISTIHILHSASFSVSFFIHLLLLLFLLVKHTILCSFSFASPINNNNQGTGEI